jgi:hypothetical protein
MSTTKRLYIILAITVIALAVRWGFLCFYAPALKISPETTYLTEPLMSDGKRIDYFRAIENRLYPPEMKTDDNGYRMLVRALGDPTDYKEFGKSVFSYKYPDSEPFRLQVYEKLGLDPNIPPTLKIESGLTFLERYIKEHPDEDEEQLWQRFGSLWTFENLPMMQDWLAENEPGINLLSEAVRKPVFYAPLVRKNESDTGNKNVIQAFREFARAAQARANYRIGLGDIDGAMDDIITCYRLARHVGKQGSLVDYLVGIAIEGMATAVPIGANPVALPSREQLQRLFDAIQSLPPPQKLEDCWEAERLFTLAFLQEYAFGRTPDVYGVPEYGRWCSAVDWNYIFREYNDVFDSIIAGIPQKEENEVGEEDFAKLQAWMAGNVENPPVKLTVRGRTQVVLRVLGYMHSPAPQLASEPERRRQCFMNMKLLTLALLLYEKDNGSLPDDDWREAVKPYLGEDSARYFRCPSCPMADDETTYVMIRRESGETPTTPYALLLVETLPPMKMSGNDGTIPVAEAIRQLTASEESRHHTSNIVSYRSGAVSAIPTSVDVETLEKLIDGTADSPP